MNNVIAIENKRAFNKDIVNKNCNIHDKLGKSASLILIAIMFIAGSVLALFLTFP